MTFFIDNNLSELLAKGLKAFGEDVIHLKDVFAENEKDPNWLEYVGENGLILISRDEHLRWHPAEIEAIRANNVGAFFLAGKQLTHCQLIQQCVHSWPRIKEIALKSRRKTPYMYRVPPKGAKFEQYYI